MKQQKSEEIVRGKYTNNEIGDGGIWTKAKEDVKVEN